MTQFDTNQTDGGSRWRRAKRLLLPLAAAAAVGIAAVGLVGSAAVSAHGGGSGGGQAAELAGTDQATLKEALANGQTIADVAEANGIDPQTVIDGLVDAASDRLDQYVESGKLTADEAAEKLADLEERITERVNTNRLQELAELVGTDAPGLREALNNGSTLAEIATANGIDSQTVIDSMVDEVESRLDEKVADGDLTQAEADEKLEAAEARITEKVNDGTGGRKFGRHGRHGRGHGWGHHQRGADNSDSSDGNAGNDL